jgi:hypothetical protein
MEASVLCFLELGYDMNLSKNNKISKISTSNTRHKICPEVRLTTKVAYISIEVPSKDRVSLNHKPHQTITKIEFGFSLSNLHEGEGYTNFMGLTTTLVALEGHLVCLGDESLRVMNT